jgi:hypothetical protein
VINAAASGDKVSGAGDRVWLNVANGAGVSMTVTITPPGATAYGLAWPAKVWTIPATSQMDIPMLAIYANPSDANLVTLTWSSTTTVTWSVRRI